MWTCSKCERIFEKAGQVHSCRLIPLNSHFKNKALAKTLFDFLVDKINKQIGNCQIISIPCCIHLFGHKDFLAALPKKNSLEIRFGLNRKLDSPKLKQTIPTSATAYKHCFDIHSPKDFDPELMDWIKEAYRL